MQGKAKRNLASKLQTFSLRLDHRGELGPLVLTSSVVPPDTNGITHAPHFILKILPHPLTTTLALYYNIDHNWVDVSAWSVN